MRVVKSLENLQLLAHQLGNDVVSLRLFFVNNLDRHWSLGFDMNCLNHCAESAPAQLILQLIDILDVFDSGETFHIFVAKHLLNDCRRLFPFRYDF